MLRSINSGGRITVFNVGWSSEEAVKVTKAGEHLVLYESAPFGYEKDAAWITSQTHHARDKGIIVWHLLHSVCREDMCSFVAKMAERGANYGYITNIGGDWEAGEDTWGALPRYWDDELAAFLAPSKPCEPKTHLDREVAHSGDYNRGPGRNTRRNGNETQGLSQW